MINIIANAAEPNSKCYYAIRHRASGKYIPLMKRNRGYTNWNPSVHLAQLSIETSIPRLLVSRRQAQQVINLWNSLPNAHGDMDGGIDIGPPDNRSKEDLEIIPVILGIDYGK